MATKRQSAGRPRTNWRNTMVPGHIHEWQVKLKLPVLTKPFIRAKFEEPTLRKIYAGRRRSRSQYLQEVGGEGEGASPWEAKAIDYLEKHERAIYAKILPAIAAYAESDWAEDLFEPDRDPSLTVPRGMTREQVAERIQFRHIAILERARDGVSYIEIMGECAWDREHGFMVVMHRDRVVGVYQQGTGWRDPL